MGNLQVVNIGIYGVKAIHAGLIALVGESGARVHAGLSHARAADQGAWRVQYRAGYGSTAGLSRGRDREYESRYPRGAILISTASCLHPSTMK